LWSCRDDVSRPPLAQHSLIVNSPSAPDRRFTITRRVGYNEPMRLVRLTRLQRWAGALCGAVLTLAACGAPQPAPAPDGVILRDEFGDVESGWTRAISQEQSVDYADSAYQITIEQTQVDVWGQPGLDLNDARIDAEAAWIAGPQDNAFGIACRLTGERDDASYIFFMISGDGYYAVVRQHNKERVFLNPAGGFEPLAAIDQNPGAVNRLSAVCQGESLTFTVNGEPVGAFTESELTHGDVAVMASTFNEPGVQIRFDNVIVRQP